MRVATRVTGGISGVGDVSLMRVDVGNEDREKVDDRRRRRPTLRAWWCYVGLMPAGTVCLLHVARRSM